MLDFSPANMAPIIFASMVISCCWVSRWHLLLAANGIVFDLIGIEMGLFGPQLFQALPDMLYGVMSNETLLAIPFFTFMGLILERSGMAEDLLETIGQFWGRFEAVWRVPLFLLAHCLLQPHRWLRLRLFQWG